MPRLDHLVNDERDLVSVRRKHLVKHHLVHLARERADEVEEELDDDVLALWRERRAAVGGWERRRHRGAHNLKERRTAAEELESTAAEELHCGRVFTARNFTAQVLLTNFEFDSVMSASKIAHRRLSGRTGSITQPTAIAADVDRGAELIEVCRATPLDEARPANLVLVEA